MIKFLVAFDDWLKTGNDKNNNGPGLRLIAFVFSLCFSALLLIFTSSLMVIGVRIAYDLAEGRIRLY